MGIPLWGWVLGLFLYLAFSVVALRYAPDVIAGLILDGVERPSSAAQIAARTTSYQTTLLGLGGLLAVLTLLITVHRDRTNLLRLAYEKQKHDADVQAQKEQLEHLKRVQEFQAKEAETNADNQRRQFEHLAKAQELESQKAENDRDATVTARFTQAIAQLGDTGSVAVRLGGIYSLQRIAEDSDKDRETVFLVLNAFLRENSRTTFITDPKKPALPVSADASAAVYSLVRVRGSKDKVLFELDLTGLDLREANLRGTELSRADIERADLSGAKLQGANLERAWLTDSRLKGAMLNDANLTSAQLPDVDLTDAHLSGANLTSAYLYLARLERAYLEKANLSDTDFNHADLRHAELGGANLTRTNFKNARLEGAVFKDWMYESARGWTPEQLNQAASWDLSTVWPEGHVPSSGIKGFEE